MRIAALVLSALFVLACAPAQAEADGYAFAILRGDSPIGTQRLAFARTGDTLTVDITTDIAVKVAFVTVYRYSQVTQQVWKGGRLESLDVRTDDNGKTRRVQARATPAGIEVDGPQGRIVAPADAVPTGYWNRDALGRAQAIDSHGKLVNVALAPVGPRTIQVDGRPVQATVFRVSGAADGEVGYAPDGAWISLVLNEQGNTISYRRTRDLPQK